MASLVKLYSGVYYAQFHDANRRPHRKRFSLKTKNKRTAERLLSKLESDYLLGNFDPWVTPESEEEEQEPEDIRLLGAAVDAYMASCAHLSPHTLRTYRSIFELFREHLGRTCDVTKIRSKEVLSFLDSTEANPVTRKKYLHHLGYLFRYLVRMGVMEKDLSKVVKLPRLPEQAPKSMTEAEVDRLVRTILDYAECNREKKSVPDWTWLVDIVRANVYLGLRLGEVIHVRWEHVDLNRRTLAVRNTEEFTTKRGKERVLPVAETVYEVLSRRKDERNGLPWVFTSHMGKLKPHYLSQAFLKFRRMAGLDEGISFHSTRHTFATWLAERGVPVSVIKELMGHASVTTTERYMKVRADVTEQWVLRAFNPQSSRAA